MQNAKRMLLDMSSICWMSLYAGEDKEFGRRMDFNGKSVLVNSAQHGYENAVNHIVAAMTKFNLVPSDLILVIEGENSKSLRQFILPSYKDTREARPKESYDEFNILKEMLAQTFLDLGAQVVTQDGLESDDVLGYLAKNLEGEVYVLTNDKDLSVLVEGNVHVYRRGELDENPLGPFPHKYITLYLSLVGDTDEFPGAKGFGPKAFLDLMCIFGFPGLDALEGMILRGKLEELQEDVGELKTLQKIIDAREMVYKSYQCAKLYVERVNTLRNPLKWRAGMVKPLTKVTDERLKPWAGRVKLVHAGNYAEAVKFMQPLLAASPFVTLDIETHTCDQSDDWLVEAKKKAIDDERLGVDVFGSELTSIGITFGDNRQYTFYFTVEHLETETVKNITKDQMLDVIKLIPDNCDIVVHNDSFELSVLYKTWKDNEEWQNNGWHGFLPNVRDTTDCASYVNENESLGLKKLSERVLGYQQQTYADVTQRCGPTGTIAGGTVISTYNVKIPEMHPDGTPKMDARKVPKLDDMEQPIEGEFEIIKVQSLVDQAWDKVQYRMNELTAEHVLHYGADDAICTAALMNHFRIIMEIEKTWQVFLQVEQKPAYLGALGFVQGVPFSRARLKELEREDDVLHEKAWNTMRSFLLANQWEGTVCPVYTEFTPAMIKEAFWHLTGVEFTSRARKLDKLALAVEEAAATLPEREQERAQALARAIGENDVAEVNSRIKACFSGEPQINFDSPKQMQNLLYNVLKIPVRIVNKLTPKERIDKPDLAKAVSQFNKIAQGSSNVEPLKPEQLDLLKAKAATDDTAVDFALAYDAAENPDIKTVLNALTDLKKVETRRKLYYLPYPRLMHWIDGKLHSQLNQNLAVTRRYSMSGPNLQQMPKKGEGVKVREVIVPHKRDAVIVSIDFSGQELRLMAGQSKDANMLACYIGDKLKDIHSITASGAMVKKWTQKVVDEFAEKFGGHLDRSDKDFIYDLFVHLHKVVEDAGIHKKADDLRKDAKNINFAAQFRAMALKISQMLVMSIQDAQSFLDAKYAMFPDVEIWIDDVIQDTMTKGYATTLLGARRHLQEAILADDKWIAEKAGRQAPNYKIQGSASEMTKLAMTRVWDSGILFDLDMVFIAPIHDELVWSVSREHALESIKVVHRCMTVPYANLGVPIVGSISLGPSFGKQYEVGESVNENLIQQTLDKIFEKD